MQTVKDTELNKYQIKGVWNIENKDLRKPPITITNKTNRKL